MSTPTEFTDKVVLITGAARGQGAAHVRHFASHGAHVYALDLLDQQGHELQNELTHDELDVTYRHHDVSSPGHWQQLTIDIMSRHSAVDVLVNNAGIVHNAEIADESLDAFEQTLRVNCTGVFLGMKHTWPLLIASGHGSIINIASVYGLHSNPGYIAYTASKAAVIGMTRTAAIEGAPLGIRANAISPGTVQTEQLKDEEHSYVRDATPMDRGADVSEIASAVAFLASTASSFITGVELPVDGGFSTH